MSTFGPAHPIVRPPEARCRTAGQWLAIGTFRGLVLGVTFPWVAGSVVAVFGRDVGYLWYFGMFGTVAGLLVGPALGCGVGLLAALIDTATGFEHRREVVAGAAILGLVVLSLPLAVTSAFGWAGYVGLPALYGLVSLAIWPLPPRTNGR